MVGWHHQLDGHEFEQALGIGDGQGPGAEPERWLQFCLLFTIMDAQDAFLTCRKGAIAADEG